MIKKILEILPGDVWNITINKHEDGQYSLYFKAVFSEVDTQIQSIKIKGTPDELQENLVKVLEEKINAVKDNYDDVAAVNTSLEKASKAAKNKVTGDKKKITTTGSKTKEVKPKKEEQLL